MGTRGIYGFRKNGVDKIMYNQYDCYPEGLGDTMLMFVKHTANQEMSEAFDRIKLVQASDDPSEAEKERCAEWLNEHVSSGADWYAYLRKTQNSPDAFTKNSCPFMVDAANFIEDSISCEYGYIVNLDTNQLEFWVGYQKSPDPTNRYGTTPQGDYYPCKLVKEYDLDFVRNPSLCTDEIVEEMDKLSLTN